MTATTEAPRSRVPHLEVLRLVPMVGVVATHTLMFAGPRDGDPIPVMTEVKK
jgi:peptidoglycan/LPS O-acetylase OafA/YrhL